MLIPPCFVGLELFIILRIRTNYLYFSMSNFFYVHRFSS